MQKLRFGVDLQPHLSRIARHGPAGWSFTEARLSSLADLFRLIEPLCRGTPASGIEVNIAAPDGVDPGLIPPAFARSVRFVQEDFRGVVGLRVLQRLQRPIPRTRCEPADAWRYLLGLQPDLYNASDAPASFEDDLNLLAHAADGRPNEHLWLHGLPFDALYTADTLIVVPVCAGFARAVAACMIPWCLLLHQPLPEPVCIHQHDLATPARPLDFTAFDRPGLSAAIDHDQRLALMQVGWSALFDEATECLYADGYDTDDSVATRMLLSVNADPSEPPHAFVVDHAASIGHVARALADLLDLQDRACFDHVGLRIATVELDKPPLPTLEDCRDLAPIAPPGCTEAADALWPAATARRFRS